MKRIWTIEKEPRISQSTNLHWFRVTNIRTQKSYLHYAQEFVDGQMHYDPVTERYPGYIHAELWRMVG